MSLFVVDVESDGPAPGLFSMVSFGVVRVDDELKTRFRANCAPISDRFNPDALKVCAVTREQHLGFPAPEIAMRDLSDWLAKNNDGKRVVFVSDNPAYDWQWINWYMHRYTGENPFGHTARRIGDFCAGLERDWSAGSSFKKLRVQRHTHDPADDALGNAEALIALARKHGVRLPGVSMHPAGVARPGPAR